MTDFFFARSQMAMSLAFHIIFAALGIGMPLLMAIAEGIYLRTRQPLYLDLCKRWARGTAILFAVGAVSGTVLSFELGLLWPGFMEKAGAIIGMPISLEGFAFFTEAIFIGVYLYGWSRLSPLLHWLSGVVVAVSGIFSGVFVVTANAWMNAPAGFKVVNGRITDIDPIAAMLNPASFHEVLHMTLAAFVATGFAVAAVHAFFLLRDRNSLFHRSALGIALAVACVSIPLQILSGDLSARAVSRLQPVKLAAMEALYQTQAGAPLLIGGIPNDARRTTDYALNIPITAMVIGIVLRGSAFIFRNYDSPSDAVHRRWSTVFGAASFFAPFFQGVTVGALATGQIRVVHGQVATGFFTGWLTLFALGCGLFALGLFAFLAATYLTVDTKSQPDLQNDFRLRALCSGLILAPIAGMVFFTSKHGAPEMFHGLTRWWAPFLLGGTSLFAMGALLALWLRRFVLARMAAVGQVTLILVGWSLAQYPNLVTPDVTVMNVHAPEITLRLLVLALGVGAIVLLPSLAFLFHLFKGR